VNILVIDVGTSSMRGILFRADGKKLKQHQVAYRPSYNTKGELEQSADEFVNVLATIVHPGRNRARDGDDRCDRNNGAEVFRRSIG